MSIIKKNSSIKSIFEAFKQSKRPICCIDSRLDCDAVSSALIIKRIFWQVYHRKITVTYGKDIPLYFKNIYKNIYSLKSIKTNLDPKDINFKRYDLMVFLDVGGDNHLSVNPEFKLPKNIQKINIDHHTESNNYFADLNFVSWAPSTCSILYELLTHESIKIDKINSRLLLLGIVDDTDVFQYDKIRPNDLRITAKLLEIAKLDLFDITFRLNYHEDPEEMTLRQLVYKNYHLDKKNNLAYSYATLKDFEDYGLKSDYKTNNSPANYIRKTEGINFAFYIREKNDHGRIYYDVSLRSRLPHFNVAKIAKKFNGGGHIMSSGLIIRHAKNIGEVIKLITTASQKNINGIKLYIL